MSSFGQNDNRYHDSQQQEEHYQSLKLLVASADEDGDLPIHIAAVQGNYAAVQKLIPMMLESDVSINTFNKLKQTPLHLAVIALYPPIVSELIRVGADPNLDDRKGHNVYHLAVQYDSIRCLETIIKEYTAPLDLNHRDYNGQTALHLAALTNNLAALRLLLDAGAEVNTSDGKSGRTALFFAADNDHYDACRVLIDYGADVNAAAYGGETALLAASERHLNRVVALLLEHGALLPAVEASAVPVQHKTKRKTADDKDTEKGVGRKKKRQ